VVAVPPKLPVAVFGVSPDSPVAGQTVTLTSSSTDADGKVVKQEWDLDGDGTFGDATGGTAKRSFDAGPHRVSLRVTDDRGATDTAFQTITVREAAKPAQNSGSFSSPGPTVAPTPPRSGPALLRPFPIVSLRGRLVRGGALIDALEVLQAPRGTRVEVRCRGRSCPFRRKVRTAGASNRRVRFREVRHRLRAGVLLQVFITKPGTIGKYTSFKIRGNATPLRRDRCLVPGVRKPMRCSPS
jgi:PKD domain